MPASHIWAVIKEAEGQVEKKIWLFAGSWWGEERQWGWHLDTEGRVNGMTWITVKNISNILTKKKKFETPNKELTWVSVTFH